MKNKTSFKFTSKRVLALVTCLTASLFFTSCNDSGSSRRGRTLNNTSSNSGPLFSSGFNNSGGGTTNEGTGTETAEPTPTSTSSGTTTVNPQGTYTTSTLPSEVANCKWSSDGSSGFGFTHQHVGDYSLCRPEGIENVLYVQTKNNITNRPLCFMPTSHTETSQGSSSFYIGEARCIFTKSSNEIYKVDLVKNRIGYSNYPITGVMIMKDELEFYDSPYYQYLLNPDAYMFCIQWRAQTGNGDYCYAFDNAGHYVYHEF